MQQVCKDPKKSSQESLTRRLAELIPAPWQQLSKRGNISEGFLRRVSGPPKDGLALPEAMWNGTQSPSASTVMASQYERAFKFHAVAVESDAQVRSVCHKDELLRQRT